MADYKAIKGHHIETVAGDPSVLQVGDIWYNSTLGKVRGAKRPAGAWASGGALNDGRGQMGNVGDIPAALVMGGYSPNKATCESYDGSSWTEENDLNTGRQYCAAFGSTTAALVVGGNPAAVDATETWNGSSWTTNPATLASGRQKFGTSNRSPSTSGLIFAGQNTGGPPWYSQEDHLGIPLFLLNLGMVHPGQKNLM